MKSAFGRTGREKKKKKQRGGSGRLVPCWWKGKNERFNPNDLRVKMKREHVRQTWTESLPVWLNAMLIQLTDWLIIYWLVNRSSVIWSPKLAHCW